MREQSEREKEASLEGGETHNLEIICGQREENNLIRAGKQKAHWAARGYESVEGRVKKWKHRRNKSNIWQNGENSTIHTKANESQGFATDAGGTRRHLADLLHTLDPRALSESLVEPGVSPVEVEDVAYGGVGRLLHSCRGNVTDGDA